MLSNRYSKRSSIGKSNNLSLSVNKNVPMYIHDDNNVSIGYNVPEKSNNYIPVRSRIGYVYNDNQLQSTKLRHHINQSINNPTVQTNQQVNEQVNQSINNPTVQTNISYKCELDPEYDILDIGSSVIFTGINNYVKPALIDDSSVPLGVVVEESQITLNNVSNTDNWYNICILGSAKVLKDVPISSSWILMNEGEQYDTFMIL